MYYLSRTLVYKVGFSEVRAILSRDFATLVKAASTLEPSKAEVSSYGRGVDSPAGARQRSVQPLGGRSGPGLEHPSAGSRDASRRRCARIPGSEIGRAHV